MRKQINQDDLTKDIQQRFDKLVECMNKPGVPEAVEEALFGSPDVFRNASKPSNLDTES